MSHEIKHGYRFSARRMPGDAALCVDPPCVKLYCQGNLLVSEGDPVKVGTPISDDSGFRVHSSVSGKVTAVSEGDDGEYTVTVENDYAMTLCEDVLPFGIKSGKSATEMTFEDALDAVKDGGIREGRIGKQTWRLLESYRGKTNTVAINAVRCESADFTEAACAVFEPEKLIGGIKILMLALGLRSATVYISSADRSNCDRLLELIASESMIKVCALTDKYPQSDPHLLVYAITGRELSPLSNIARSGIALFSACSAVAVYDLFASGTVSPDRYLSVEDGNDARLLRVVRGSTVKYIKEANGIDGKGYLSSLFSGLEAGDDLGISDTCETLCFAKEKEVKKYVHACNKCGECISVCPMYLFPYEFAYAGAKRARIAGASVCIECGLCEFICPSGIKLTGRIRELKRKIEESEAVK